MPGEPSDSDTDKRVTILSDIGARLARLDRYERGALWRRKLPSAHSTWRAGRLHAGGGRRRDDNTICTV